MPVKATLEILPQGTPVWLYHKNSPAKSKIEEVHLIERHSAEGVSTWVEYRLHGIGKKRREDFFLEEKELVELMKKGIQDLTGDKDETKQGE